MTAESVNSRTSQEVYAVGYHIRDQWQETDEQRDCKYHQVQEHPRIPADCERKGNQRVSQHGFCCVGTYLRPLSGKALGTKENRKRQMETWDKRVQQCDTERVSPDSC